MSLAKKCKSNLPKDWIVVNSTSFPDRVYYFNIRTNKSSWEDPSDEPIKAPKQSEKRKFSTENEKDEIPITKARSPTSAPLPKQQERQMLRAKRRPEPPEPPKAQETPQMKEMRRKMLEKKQSKVAQGEKSKPRGVTVGNCKEKVPSVTGKQSKSPKSIPQKRYSKLKGGGNAALKLVSKISNSESGSRAEEPGGSGSQSSLNSHRGSASTSSNVAKKNVRIGAGRGRNRSDSSKSDSTMNNNVLKKNLASKRLDTLRKKLKVERKKIEPTITAKVVGHVLSQNKDNEPKDCDTSFDSDAKNKFKRNKSPTELPSISQNVKSRFKALAARLMGISDSSSATISESNKQSDRVAVRMPKIPKTNKKPVKKGGKAGAVNNEATLPSREEHSVAENQRIESFWEEMEWEPIEEAKVVSEIQEVRTQLITDQATQPKLPNCRINGLELPLDSQKTDERMLYVVVDTNVYLSNLKTVTELLEDGGKFNGHYRPVVVVPWTVLQELDYIKDNKSKTKSAHLQQSAKAAVDLLFRYFSSKHPRVKGQTAAEAASNRMKFRAESPDDEILQSCLQIRELGYPVVLLSNDKNLCNKAMIHDVSTYGRHQSIQEMLAQNKSLVESSTSKELSKNIENKAKTVDSEEAEISDDIFCEAKAIIKNFLSIIVSKEMENLYGENWKKYTIVQPPWSVIDVLKCTSKHWIAAISDVFEKRTETLVSKLSKMFLDAPKYGQSLRHVNEVLDVCLDLVQMVKSNNYQELAEKTLYDIKELLDSCKIKVAELEETRSQAIIEHENNNLNEEERANNAFKYFEQIWTFTNNFCGLAADLTGIPHCITYKSFEPALPVETLNRIQPELVFNLNQLIHSLRTVLNDDEYLTPDHPALISLYQSLLNYFPNSGELNDTRSLNMDVIDLFCCIRVKKEFLKTGLAQLQELCYQFCRIADFRSSMSVAVN